jgi:trk system potassium uptake protein TrkA
MNIIICGAGEVGSHAAEVLAAAGNNVTVIDTNAERLRAVGDTMDVGTLVGNGAHAHVLLEAGCASADLVVAATNSDEINLLCASIAKPLGAARTIARVHSGDFFEAHGLDYQKHFSIDQLICPEFATATAIARTMRNPAALAIEHFARGRIEMQEFAVSDNASALNRPLASLRLPRSTRIGAVVRNGQVFIPEGTTEIRSGDRIMLVANSDVFYEARRQFYKEDAGRRSVIIMGGPITAVWLCRALKDRNWSIRLFETSRARAQTLAQALPWVTVLNADPTERSVYEEERLGQADVFVALLDDDEDNIIGSVLAKSLGVTQVISVVQRSNYIDLLYHIGVDRPFSPRVVAAREIEALLDDSPIRLLASLAEGDIDAYQVRVTEQTPIVGKALKEIKLTPDWVIAAIRRGDAIWVPTADDAIQRGDTVLVIGRHGMEKPLKKLMVG